MKQSIYQKKNREAMKRKARKLYRAGLSLRDVGKAFKPPKSHQWVSDALDKVDKT